MKARRRTCKDRGAAIVEFAISLPLLVGLLIGMIDFGMIVNDHQTLREATRTAARQAIVGAAPSDGCSTSGLTGDAGAETIGLICGVKNSGLTGDVRVKLSLTEFDEGEQLTLCSMATTDSILGVHEIVAGGTANAKITMRIENTDYGVYGPAQESPLPGSDWSWCA